MDTRPKSKRAIIITSVAVLLLLIVVYLLFTKSSIFGTKGSSIAKKSFEPLLGTSKEKKIDPLEDLNNNGIKDSEENPATTTGGGVNGDTSGGTGGDVGNGESITGGGVTGGTGEVPQNGGTGGISGNFIIPSLQSLPLPNGVGNFNVSNLNTPIFKFTDPCNNSDDKVKAVGAKELVDNNGKLCAGISADLLPKLNLTLKPECSDGIDNDKDKLIDNKDPQCHTDGNAKNNGPVQKTTSLATPPQKGPKAPTCSDKIDNDLNGKADIADPMCHADGNANNLASYIPVAQEVTECNDKMDNDHNGLIDADDPTCHMDMNPANAFSYDPKIDLEFTPIYECSDGKDNEGNGLKDRNDPSCHTDKNAKNTKSYDPQIDREGTDTYDPKISKEAKGANGAGGGSYSYTPQCADGKDNDNDKLIDTKDPGCHTDLDASNANTYDKDRTNEINFIPQCNDKIDNDNDGLADAKDPGCHDDLDPNNAASYNKQKYMEFNFIAQCKDLDKNGNKVDNDKDGTANETDPGCHNDLSAKNASSYDPNKMLEFNVVPQCSDGKDNDGDSFIDADDTGCWADGKDKKTYNPEYGSEYTSGLGTSTAGGTAGTATGGTSGAQKKQCTDDDQKLKFTDDELRQLAELTKQFNRLAPFLKSEFDVKVEKDTAINYQYIIDNARELTRQCYAQTSTAKYTQNANLSDDVNISASNQNTALTSSDAPSFYNGLTSQNLAKIKYITAMATRRSVQAANTFETDYFINILVGTTEVGQEGHKTTSSITGVDNIGLLADNPAAYKFRIYKECTQGCFYGHKTEVDEFNKKDYLQFDFNTEFVNRLNDFNQSELAVINKIRYPASSTQYDVLVNESMLDKGRYEVKVNPYYNSDDYSFYNYIRKPPKIALHYHPYFKQNWISSYFDQCLVDLQPNGAQGWTSCPWTTWELTWDIW